MVTRFAEHTRAVVRQAGKEAEAAGSPVIEAEHLLLALASAPGTEAYDVLTADGLGHDAVSAALDEEMRQSLAVAGVVLPPGGLPGPSRDPARKARLGASSKRALQRALKASSGQRQIRPGHLLLGVLGAQAGTVPRALAVAGADQAGLIRRTKHVLATGPE
jgi:ATP-dependent Clp protease ATP-binding subunit ClpA